jgi:Tfp pilus assembly protein PilZ
MTAIEKQNYLEKREFRRKKCFINVGYAAYLDTNHIAVIKDISRGGAFIDTQSFLDIGQEVLLKIQLPGLPKPMGIIGEVAWHHPIGMGVKFKMGFGASVIESFMDTIEM